MAEYTENLNLKKPAQDEQYNVDDFNDNFDKIDDFAGLTPPRALTADKLTTGAKINGVNFKGDTDIITGLGLYSDTNTYNNTNLAYLYDNGKLKIFQSTQNGNIGHNPLTSFTYWKEIQIGSKAHYGEIVTSSLPITDNHLHLADGSVLDSTNYEELVNYISDLYSQLPADMFSSATQDSDLGSNSWCGVAYGSNKYVALGTSGYVSIGTVSNNTITWTQASQDLTSSYTWSSIVYNGSNFVAFAYGNNYCYASIGSISGSSITWSTPSAVKSYEGAGTEILIYGNGKYITRNTRNNFVLTISEDLSNWSSVTLPNPISSAILKVLINTFTDHFIILIQDTNGFGNTVYLYESHDGENWSIKATDFVVGGSGTWSCLIYDDQKYIAIKTDGTTSTSINGTTWTTPASDANLGSNRWQAITRSNSEVVALGSTGYVSTKGIAPYSVFTTEADWQNTVQTYGECGKYVYNSSANTVRIPLVNSYFTNTINPQNLGNLTLASIPNIKGEIPASENVYKSGTPEPNYGAFSRKTANVVSGKSENTNFDNDIWDFDASRISSVYSDTATTVNTQSIKQLVYIVVKE